MAYTDIDKSDDYFNTKLYSGTGSSQAVTGVGFQPDWLWIKNRGTADENVVHDSVRGVGKRLITDGTQAEATTTNQVSSFDSDGFTVPGGSNNTGASSNNYVAWNWLASNTTASNTDGSITSTVSANTTSGFSIVSYTGTDSVNTIGHGLGSKPKMIIVKDRDAANDWFVYAEAIGYSMSNPDPETDYLKLNSTNARVDDSTLWNDTAPTSSLFTIGTNGNINTTGNDYIAYCFADVKGFSKFGSYTGNGNADGTFVYTGFKPAWVMRKVASGGTGGWAIYDNKREPENVMDKELFANSNSAEGSFTQMDFLSNGFKFRTSNSAGNGSGYTYIYMAFAEEPLVGDNPATAR
jgi:hypothetical protein